MRERTGRIQEPGFRSQEKETGWDSPSPIHCRARVLHAPVRAVRPIGACKTGALREENGRYRLAPNCASIHSAGEPFAGMLS